MNKKETIATAIEALAAHGLKAKILKMLPLGGAAGQPDALIRIEIGEVRVEFVAMQKRHITAATLGATLAQMRTATKGTDKPNLLVADYVTPPMAETLRAQGQAFIDAAGNAYIKGPGLLVFVVGRRKPANRPRANQVFTIGGLKVLFAMICEPGLAEAPQRRIAEAAGVALGTVPNVLADLKQTGRVLTAGKHKRLNATKHLLDEWAQAYAQRLRPKNLLATYHAPNFAKWKKWPLHGDAIWWGGEPAANLLVGYLKPGALTLYAHALPPRLKVEQRLTTAEVNARLQLLEVRELFWGATLRHDAHPKTVPPALVYADLLATGDARCIETAGMVYDNFLARLFPAG